MLQPPCYKCPDRQPNCHGYCEKYLEYRDKCDELAEKRRKEAEMESIYWGGKPRKSSKVARGQCGVRERCK